MEKRKIGSLQVPPLAFGGNVFGWTVDKKASYRLLDGLTDAGLNFIDTADVYSTWVRGNSGGESETIIGKWLNSNGKRNQVVIATKVGSIMSESKKGLSGKYIIRAVEDSLKRLQTDYIDLYQSHKDDQPTPMEETLEAYDQLIKQGKVKVIGASNFTADRLAKALEISKQHGYAAYQCLQPEYNLIDRADFEENLESLCLEKGISVISYYSLASGFLSGKYRSEADFNKSPRGGGMKKYLNERGFRILKALDDVSEKYNATPTQVSLAWLMARPSITAPIVSATTIDQLQDLIKAVDLKLDTQSIELLTAASAY